MSERNTAASTDGARPGSTISTSGMDQTSVEGKPSVVHVTGMDVLTLMRQVDYLTKRLQELETIDKAKSPMMNEIAAATSTTLNAKEEGKSTDKDLNRLLKVVGKIRLDPHDEEQFENMIDKWEEACETLDIEFWSLRILSLRLGSEFIRDWIRKNPRNGRTWEDYKNALARYLFPDSDYLLQLEDEIMKQERTWKIPTAITIIIKKNARHDPLLKRWGKSGELKDDKFKQALLNKIPKSEIANCLRVREYQHISFYDFSRACRGCLHATDKQSKVPIAEKVLEKEQKPADDKEKESEKEEKEKDEALVCVVQKRKRIKKVEVEQEPDPWAHVKCYNCGKKGHRVRDCHLPRKRCENCGRVGHKTETCWKGEYPSATGGTKTTYFRRTKQGVHLHLVDASTQGNLINAMQMFLDARKAAMEKAKLKA